ncbi:MAG TPA: glycosyltransferase family 2 protein [Planctomycetota bacterium]|jgi:glycosyltransferase involved in cell wall biosynthesis|nr:glycosyltransferase family 2 protein [Planctomycetota bacterium]
MEPVPPEGVLTFPGSDDLAGLCVVLPAFREAATIASLVRAIRARGAHVIVVDDGSDDGTSPVARAAGAEVLRHASNRGKGAALRTGFERALALGFPRLATMDGDGQHDPADLGGLLAVALETGAEVVVGNRMDDPRGMSRSRLFTNRLTSAVISWLGGIRVADSQCGLKLYDAAVLRALRLRTERMDTESEILLQAGRLGFAVRNAPVRCIYHHPRPSHIRAATDTWRFLRLTVPFLLRRSSQPASPGPVRSVTVPSATRLPSTRHSPS